MKRFFHAVLYTFNRAYSFRRVMLWQDILRFLLYTAIPGSRRLRFYCKPFEQFIVLRTRTTDFAVFEKVVLAEDYRLPFEQNPKTIIDAGANVGLSALYFAWKYPSAHILAVEPEASNFDILCENCRSNSKITPMQCAVWCYDGEIHIKNDGEAKWAFSVSVDGSGASIPALTIGTLVEKMGWNNVDLIKLDIEGAEKEVFSSEELSWLSKVTTIVIELHDWFKAGCESSFFSAVSHRIVQSKQVGENVFVLLR